MQKNKKKIQMYGNVHLSRFRQTKTYLDLKLVSFAIFPINAAFTCKTTFS